MSFQDFCGWVGTILLLIAYWLVSSDRIEAWSFTNQWMNFFGAAGIGFNAWTNGLYAVVVLDIFWAGVALFTIRSMVKDNAARNFYDMRG